MLAVDRRRAGGSPSSREKQRTSEVRGWRVPGIGGFLREIVVAAMGDWQIMASMVTRWGGRGRWRRSSINGSLPKQQSPEPIDLPPLASRDPPAAMERGAGHLLMYAEMVLGDDVTTHL
ncbi:hypothetical protein EJB05_27276 [Eragrostis curvula]|uniref:Uncharacterized protein n=1 Tax=Eragrostis curvula TaxID=38414 RepID=A0A5J9UMM7_9POAL|nr:hypothetical protein EJB05_27276 [Eragrostis curvula]